VYEDLFKSYPEDENIPYALSKLGDCYEKLSLSIDRDQAYTLKGIERLTYLKNRYPASAEAKAMEPKLKNMLQRLADRELYVGEFYYRTSQYNGAIMRLEYFIKKYPDAKGLDKALFYLALSWREMGEQAKSDQYLEMLRTQYPNSLYTRSSIRGRKTLQQAKAGGPLPLYEETKKRNIPLTPHVEAKGDEVAKEEKGKEKEKDKGLSFFDKKKPVDIVSDTMEGFDKEKYVVFKGKVVAKQEDLFIFADAMEAYTSEGNNEIEKVHAKGNVKIVKQDRTATCQEAIFENAKGEITLKGNVIVYQGQDKLAGDVIIYYVNEDRVVVQADKDKKAHITVQPKQETK
jgi:lipopolysaccharide export system protein LptA